MSGNFGWRRGGLNSMALNSVKVLSYLVLIGVAEVERQPSRSPEIVCAAPKPETHFVFFFPCPTAGLCLVGVGPHTIGEIFFGFWVILYLLSRIILGQDSRFYLETLCYYRPLHFYVGSRSPGLWRSVVLRRLGPPTWTYTLHQTAKKPKKGADEFNKGLPSPLLRQANITSHPHVASKPFSSLQQPGRYATRLQSLPVWQTCGFRCRGPHRLVSLSVASAPAIHPPGECWSYTKPLFRTSPSRLRFSLIHTTAELASLRQSTNLLLSSFPNPFPIPSSTFIPAPNSSLANQFRIAPE